MSGTINHRSSNFVETSLHRSWLVVFFNPQGDVLRLQVGSMLHQHAGNFLTTVLEERSLAGKLKRTRRIVVFVKHLCSSCDEIGDHFFLLLPDSTPQGRMAFSIPQLKIGSITHKVSDRMKLASPSTICNHFPSILPCCCNQRSFSSAGIVHWIFVDISRHSILLFHLSQQLPHNFSLIKTDCQSQSSLKPIWMFNTCLEKGTTCPLSGNPKSRPSSSPSLLIVAVDPVTTACCKVDNWVSRVSSELPFACEKNLTTNLS